MAAHTSSPGSSTSVNPLFSSVRARVCVYSPLPCSLLPSPQTPTHQHANASSLFSPSLNAVGRPVLERTPDHVTSLGIASKLFRPCSPVGIHSGISSYFSYALLFSLISFIFRQAGGRYLFGDI
eukprot:scpid62861/ scgid11744/ 